MKKLITVMILLLLASLPTFAGDVKTINVTSGTQMQPGGGVSIAQIVYLKNYDLLNWKFSFQLAKTETGELGATSPNGGVTPVFYASNILYSSSDPTSWGSTGTNYIVPPHLFSTGTSLAYTLNSSISPFTIDFSSAVTPASYMAIGFLCAPDAGVTPNAVIHMR